MEALGRYLSPADILLSEIFLDPNNPRFTGSDWIFVPDADALTDDAQMRARKRLIGEFDVLKLQANMEVNGYLPIDRVVVRKLSENAYVVLEGNRRVCAAKLIGQYTASGEPVSTDVIESLQRIPALIYTGDDTSMGAAWIFQGLRHITGLIDWSAYHKAKLLVEQMDSETLSLTEVGRRFGLSPYGAGQWVRGYHAFRAAKDETDYGSVIDERLYPYLQEVFGRSSIPVREWLAWNDENYTFGNKANLNEFIGWFYPNKSSDDSEDPQPVSKEAWDRRIISKRDDIRQISYLIHEDPKEWLSFRQNHDLEGAYSRAQIAKYERDSEIEDFSISLFRAIEKCTASIQNTPISVIKNADLKLQLDTKLEALKAAIALL